MSVFKKKKERGKKEARAEKIGQQVLAAFSDYLG